MKTITALKIACAIALFFIAANVKSQFTDGSYPINDSTKSLIHIYRERVFLASGKAYKVYLDSVTSIKIRNRSYTLIETQKDSINFRIPFYEVVEKGRGHRMRKTETNYTLYPLKGREYFLRLYVEIVNTSPYKYTVALEQVSKAYYEEHVLSQKVYGRKKRVYY